MNQTKTMNSLFLHLISAQIILTLGYLAYLWWYKKENNFLFNRYFLPALFMVALLVPSMPFSVPMPHFDQLKSVVNLEANDPPALEVQPDDATTLPASTPVAAQKKENILNSWDAWFLSEVLIRLYGLMALFFAFRFVVQLFSLWKLLRNSQREWEGDHYLISIHKEIQPFSFFNTIVINPDLYTSQQYEMIYQHELVHVRQWHNLDIILGELCTILFWANPVAWRLKHTIRQNLEFIVDHTLLHQGTNRKIYQYSLVAINMGNNPQLVIANYFNQSLLKKRIIMMNKKKSPDSFSFRHLLIFPLLVLMSLLQVPATGQQPSSSGSATGDFSIQADFDDKDALKDTPVKEGEKLFGIVRSDLHMEDLQAMQEEFKKRGIDLKYSNLDFTKDGQIARIKLEMTHWNQKNSMVELNNNGKPIDEYIVAYFFHDHEGKKAEMGIQKQFPRGSFGKDDTDRLLKSVAGVIIIQEEEAEKEDHIWIKGHLDLSKEKLKGILRKDNNE